MSAAVVILAAVATGCIPAARALAHARWPYRSPAAGILLWQGLGLGWGLAAVGALLGIGAAGYRSGVAGGAFARLASVGTHWTGPGQAALSLVGVAQLGCLAAGLALLAVLCWILLAAAAAVVRARKRQRVLLSLLAHGDPKVPGALVVDHPAAAAYCLPGLRSAIVLSAGVLNLLDDHELAAVLAHERAHLRERHDLVLLPFSALLRAFRWASVARQAQRAVALLVEMQADDRALRHRPARELATALLRVGAAGGGAVPSGALAATEPGLACDVTTRVIRILRPAPGLCPAARVLTSLTAATAVGVPIILLALPVR
ncbi:MAG TPA: M56 family metallopeptidase [Streptosporangiaceae bacterium]|nr:M56 family metallopeptidase [Streptosporangiaceae bacterium]